MYILFIEMIIKDEKEKSIEILKVDLKVRYYYEGY